MAKRGYPKRYAQAIFEIALEAGELDRWQNDLARISHLSKDAALMAALESPRFPSDAKAKILTERLAGINPLVLNLTSLLIARGSLGMVDGIIEEYQRLVDSHQGIERAEVTTAVPIDDREKEKLAEVLGEIIGKQVVLKMGVDANLLGGVVARVGGKMMDGSTRSKLASLRKELAEKAR